MNKPNLKAATQVSMLSILLFIFTIASAVGQTVELKALWQSEPHLDTPESVFYSASENLMYVSCINGDPTEKNGKGYISKVNLDGTPHTSKWVEGLNAPKGIDVLDGMLYATNIDEFVIINTKTENIEKKIKVDGAIFLNDVACDKENNCVYFSDSRTGIVYRYQNDSISVYFQNKEVSTVNGLYNTKDILYLGSLDLLALNKLDKKVEKIVLNTGQIDGLQGIGTDLFIGTNWSGRIMLLKKGSTLKVLEDSETKGFKTADFGINREDQIIYVPTFFGNTIRTYSYTIQK